MWDFGSLTHEFVHEQGAFSILSENIKKDEGQLS